MASQAADSIATASPRRERRRLEVHNRILESALDLFNSQGVAATTVAQICERADVAQKTFFNHFPAKQEMLRELALQAIETLSGDIAETSRQTVSTRERIGTFFERIVDNIESAGPMHRELVVDLIDATHHSGSEGEQQRVLYEAFADVIRTGRAKGDVVGGHSIESQAELVLGAFYVLMFNWAHIDGYPLRRRARAAARLLADVLCTST